MFDKSVESFEKIIAIALIALFSIVVLLSTMELAILLYKDVTNTSGVFLGQDDLYEIFSMFMLVLIALELLASIHMYLKDRSIHIEIMFLVAITAVTRKIVLLDSKEIEPLTVIGLALLVAALAVGYYLIKRQQIKD